MRIDRKVRGETMSKKVTLSEAYAGIGRGLTELKSEVASLREENKKLRDGLEKYRGQINQYGENTAADDLTHNV
jgi:regulator of replication initiation timing